MGFLRDYFPVLFLLVKGYWFYKQNVETRVKPDTKFAGYPDQICFVESSVNSPDKLTG